MKSKAPAEVAERLAVALESRLGSKCEVFISQDCGHPDGESWDVRSDDIETEIYLPSSARELLLRIGLSQEEWIVRAIQNGGASICIRKIQSVTRPEEWFELVCDRERLAIGVRRNGSSSLQPVFTDDLEVPLEICFGRKQVTLSDVESIRKDQIVELDDAVNAPVELLASGKLLARGVAVVVDGCYGIEITEMCI